MNTQTRQQSAHDDQRTQSASVPALAPSRLPIAPSIAKEFEIQPADWRVLVDQIFPAAKSVEAIMMALAYCRKRNLDIFKKPVHIVPMWSSAKRQMVETVWPGIAEIRTTATRTGSYAGIDAVEFGPIIERSFEGVTDQWEDGRKVSATIKKAVRFPEWASVVVYRVVGGNRCAYHAKVYWEETYATVGKTDLPNDMWAKRPRGQLDKCVEAAALRKAFPEELGNTYAAEEMEGREIDGVTIDHVAQPKPPKAPRPPEVTATVAPTIDHGTIDHDDHFGDADEMVMDDNEFLQQLEDALATATDAVSVTEVWNEADPLARFDGNDEKIGIAKAMKNARMKQIAGAA